MIPRPIIDAVATSIRLPGYMRLDEPVPVADDVHRIEAPIDSHVVFEATVSGDVARGEIVLLKRSVSTEETARKSTPGSTTICRPTPKPNAPGDWTTARAYTGLKSFTFGRGHLPLGLTPG